MKRQTRSPRPKAPGPGFPRPVRRAPPPDRPVTSRPRLGLLGVGWIGRSRMKAIVESGVAEIAALVDIDPVRAEEARASAPGAVLFESYGEMLEADLDGVVIATPSAGHADQSIVALERGLPVFCQKPLGRNAVEAAAVVRAAEHRNRLLGVDLSYRFLKASKAVRDLVRSGEIGRVYAADLIFHNAYGPDQPWYYDPVRSGGGCVMDLGVHLVDFLFWCLDRPGVRSVNARLFSGGRRLRIPSQRVEDYADVRIDLEDEVCARVACSWNLHAGRDAFCQVIFYGTNGSALLRNVAGSFYDFRAEHWLGTETTTLVEPPDPWGGRAVLAWANRIARNGGAFDPVAWEFVDTAETLDAIYRSGSSDIGATYASVSPTVTR